MRYNIHHNLTGITKSTKLFLNPPAFNEVESNYTCTVENFLNSTNYTYKVKLPVADEGPPPSTSPTLAILVGVLTLATIIFVVVLIIWKPHLVSLNIIYYVHNHMSDVYKNINFEFIQCVYFK